MTCLSLSMDAVVNVGATLLCSDREGEPTDHASLLGPPADLARGLCCGGLSIHIWLLSCGNQTAAGTFYPSGLR